MSKFSSTIFVKAELVEVESVYNAFNKFCNEHGFVASKSITKAFAVNEYGVKEFAGYNVCFGIENVENIGSFEYASYNMSYNDYDDLGEATYKLTAAELDEIHEMKTCMICGSTRNRSSVEVIRVNGALNIVGFSCLNRFYTAYYFMNHESMKKVNTNSDYIECASFAYGTNLYTVLGFVNSFNEPFAGTKVRVAFRYMETTAKKFFNNMMHSDIIASEEEVNDLLKDIDQLDENNDFHYKIKRILQEAAESGINGVRTAAAPLLIGYLSNRKERKAIESAEDFEEAKLDKTEATLVCAKYFIKEVAYENTLNTKLVFKTADNKIVVWYTSSNKYNDLIGHKFMISCKTASIGIEYGKKVLRAKRLSCKEI